jgi:predicted outer membrane repeat protein
MAMKRAKHILISVFMFTVSVCGFSGVTLQVGPDDTYTSIQAAIGSAVSGDQIVVAPGTYSESINFLGKAVHLVSSDGPAETIIDGDGHYHVVQCVTGEDPNTILEGFTLTRGNANGPTDADQRGGGMLNYLANPTIKNCTFAANKAKYGAGMYNDQSSPTITDCVFEKNTTHNGLPDKYPADNGGCGAGMYNVNSSPAISDCLFKENATGSGGKGASGKYRLFSTGLAGYTGGEGGSGAGIYNDNSHPAVTGCDFNANVTGNGGEGGKGEDGGVMIGMGFDGGKGGKGGIGGAGGGMYNCNQSSPVVSSCHFTANRTGTGGNGGDYGLGGSGYDPSGTGGGSSGASGNGGDGGQGGTGAGMFNQDSSPSVSDCTFTKNVTGRGGHSIWGVYKYSRFIEILTDFTGGNISGGFIGFGGGGGDGAGMYTVSGSPVVTACAFGQNETGGRGKGKIAALVDDFGSGAGMYNAAGSHSAMTSCTFSGNVGYCGGGVFNADSDPEITYCTFRSNAAYQDGGAIFNDASVPTIAGGLFLKNVAHRYGSALYNTQSSPVVTNCTLYANASYENDGGSGINNFNDSNPVLTNCILWDNTPGEINNDLSEPVVTYCNVKGGYSGTGNINVDPLFCDSLGRLSSGSPCTGTGDNSAANLPDRDLDGNRRMIGSFVDLGAFELTELPIHNVTTDTFYDRIQIAIADANDFDQIRVLPGTYAEAIHFLGKAVRLYSSDGPEVTIINGTGHYHVVQCVSGEGPDTVLDGFTLTGGNANGPTEADKRGGGMRIVNSSPTVTGCIIKTNLSDGPGGGMYVESGSPTVTHCSFIHNATNSSGGGMYSRQYSSPAVTHCIFSGNEAVGGAGMVNTIFTQSKVTNCIFIGNTTTGKGGGMYNYWGSHPTVTHCTFSGNTATDGGGIYNETNCNPTVVNSILWGNSPNAFLNVNSSPVVSYSNIQGGFAGTGNNDADPLLVAAAGSNVRLSDGSPCIDTGNNSAVPVDLATDLDGDERFRDGNLDGSEVVDMGAYEYYGRVMNTTTHAVYGTIQNAIFGAQHGDRVVVTPGIYYERINFSGMNISLSSIDPNDPDVVAQTILDGQHIDRVVTFASNEGTGSACLLDGVTIRNGYAQEGAGIYCFQSSPTIRNCQLRRNVSFGYGSIIWVEWGLPAITGCTISNNIVYGAIPDKHSGALVFLTWDDILLKDCTIHNNLAGGGAIRFIGEDDWWASLTVIGCTITENVNPGRLQNMFDPLNDGGGIYFGRGRLFIEDCYVSGNRARSDGGGVWIEEAAFVEISRSSIINNQVMVGCGGGIGSFSIYGECTIDRCEISGNSSGAFGGGLYNYYGDIINSTICDNTSRSGGGLSGGYAAIANSVFTNNSSGSGGGLGGLEGSMTNSLILANRATSYGGGLYNCTAALTNNIIRQNMAEIDGDQLYGGSVPSYSNIEDWAGGGVGNRTLEPGFRTPGVWVDISDPNVVVGPDDPNALWLEGNYRLTAGSPCIDAGDNAAVPTGVTTDLNGWSRFMDDPCTTDTGSGTLALVDMGAYEFVPADVDSSGAVNFADLGFMAGHWQHSGGDCAGADMNCDGAVDLADLVMLTDHWLEGGEG